VQVTAAAVSVCFLDEDAEKDVVGLAGRVAEIGDQSAKTVCSSSLWQRSPVVVCAGVAPALG
jgi:hypothetical protein